MQELLGKTIAGVKLSDDKSEIEFTSDTGEVLRWFTEGECCSYTWIDHCDDVRGTIVNVEEIDLPVPEDVSDYDVLTVYGYRFRNSFGETFQLEFRNDSNGYYGGELVFDRKGK